ncbi:MAG TPA: hypothetical protein ENN19_18575 [Chloroflexi bacterium]|nr:hypothetical protein [Chloroflexota bacterium]
MVTPPSFKFISFGIKEYIPVLELKNWLELINTVLTSGIVIFSGALLLYLIIYNLRTKVTRSFIGLLACVLITYFADLALVGVEGPGVATIWLRIQWIGITFTPAAYLDFSNALLATTGTQSKKRDIATRISYLLSAGVLLGVGFSDWIVRDGKLLPGTPRLFPGPLFPLFVLYFLTTVIWGTINVFWARSRCLTSTSRRRMTYLAATVAAPAAGVFPFLLITGVKGVTAGLGLWLLLVLGNIGVGWMLVVLAYSVAFFGALTPDRAVKHRLVRFLLRGPFAATLVVVVIIVASRTEQWIGLPGSRLVLFGAVATVILIQLGIELAKPLIDRALYRQDQPEIAWIQDLSNRLLTTTDLRQFLENVLTALCDLLRVKTAFITVIDGNTPHLEVVCGSLDPRTADKLPPEAWQTWSGETLSSSRRLERHNSLFVWNGYWLAPLYTQDQTRVIGVVGMTARAPEPDLTPEEREGLTSLLAQATAALEDRQLQQGIFSALEHIIPEIEDIQRRRGVMYYVGEEALTGFDLVENEEFRQSVHDALNHYWGGPNLTAQPLLSLRIVEHAVQEYGGNTIKGVRAVLREAIERLRPDGQRKMTAPEWLLYNILELKFLQGHKVREVAHRLVMSESDLYRKQRIAIEAVTQALAEMEEQESLKENGSSVQVDVAPQSTPSEATDPTTAV